MSLRRPGRQGEVGRIRAELAEAANICRRLSLESECLPSHVPQRCPEPVGVKWSRDKVETRPAPYLVPKREPLLRLARSYQLDGSCWLVSVVTSLRFSGMWKGWFLAAETPEDLTDCQFLTAVMMDAYVRRNYYSGVCTNTDVANVVSMLKAVRAIPTCNEHAASHDGMNDPLADGALETVATTVLFASFAMFKVLVTEEDDDLQWEMQQFRAEVSSRESVSSLAYAFAPAVVRALIGAKYAQIAAILTVEGMLESLDDEVYSQTVNTAWDTVEGAIDLANSRSRTKTEKIGRLQILESGLRKALAAMAAYNETAKSFQQQAKDLVLHFAVGKDESATLAFKQRVRAALQDVLQNPARLSTEDQLTVLLADLRRRLGPGDSVIKTRVENLMRAFGVEDIESLPVDAKPDAATEELVRVFGTAWGDAVPDTSGGIVSRLRQYVKLSAGLESRASLLNAPSSTFEVSAYVGPMSEAFVRASVVLYAQNPMEALGMVTTEGGYPIFPTMGLLNMGMSTGKIYLLSDKAMYQDGSVASPNVPLDRSAEGTRLQRDETGRAAVVVHVTAHETCAGLSLQRMLEQERLLPRRYVQFMCGTVVVYMFSTDLLIGIGGGHAIGLTWDATHAPKVEINRAAALLTRMEAATVRNRGVLEAADHPRAFFGNTRNLMHLTSHCVFGDDFRKCVRELLPPLEHIYVVDPLYRSTPSVATLMQKGNVRWARQLFVDDHAGSLPFRPGTFDFLRVINRASLQGLTLVGEIRDVGDPDASGSEDADADALRAGLGPGAALQTDRQGAVSVAPEQSLQLLARSLRNRARPEAWADWRPSGVPTEDKTAARRPWEDVSRKMHALDDDYYEELDENTQVTRGFVKWSEDYFGVSSTLRRFFGDSSVPSVALRSARMPSSFTIRGVGFPGAVLRFDGPPGQERLIKFDSGSVEVLYTGAPGEETPTVATGRMSALLAIADFEVYHRPQDAPVDTLLTLTGIKDDSAPKDDPVATFNLDASIAYVLMSPIGRRAITASSTDASDAGRRVELDVVLNLIPSFLRLGVPRELFEDLGLDEELMTITRFMQTRASAKTPRLGGAAKAGASDVDRSPSSLPKLSNATVTVNYMPEQRITFSNGEVSFTLFPDATLDTEVFIEERDERGFRQYARPSDSDSPVPLGLLGLKPPILIFSSDASGRELPSSFENWSSLLGALTVLAAPLANLVARMKRLSMTLVILMYGRATMRAVLVLGSVGARKLRERSASRKS